MEYVIIQYDLDKHVGITLDSFILTIVKTGIKVESQVIMEYKNTESITYQGNGPRGGTYVPALSVPRKVSVICSCEDIGLLNAITELLNNFQK